MSNFEFLRKNNINLFNIISEAEKLFRDEYFEQVTVQTRRFGENVCRDLLQDNVLPDETFDSMINRIKDKSFGKMRVQEFSDDLYFLKKHGNTSAHSSVAVKDGKIALECIERAYEIAIFYSNSKYGYNKKLDESVFSEEMLMTGKKTGAKSSPKKLKERYSEELVKNREKSPKNKSKKPSASLQKTKPARKTTKRKNTQNNKNETFLTILYLVVFVAIILLGHFFL